MSRAKFGKRWEPTKWQPVYEQILLMSAQGFTNVAIAERFGYTPMQISNILNSQKAMEEKAKLIAALREKMLATADENISSLYHQAVTNIKEVLTDKNLLNQSPFQMFRASMDFMRGIGKLKPVNETNITTTVNQAVFTQDIIDRIKDGIKTSIEIKEAHGAKS